jgi:hypothetical protein
LPRAFKGLTELIRDGDWISFPAI